MAKSNSWLKLSTIKPGCNPEAMFGCTEFKNERDYLYNDRVMKLGATIIWIPSKQVHICVASYVDAFRNGDEEAIAKLAELGVPAGINFGYGPKDDLTCMYTVQSPDARRRGRRPGSGPVVKVMRAEFDAEFDDGARFKAGTVVKIEFRNRFVEDRGGRKIFRNTYLRPSAEEIAAFLKSERKETA